MLDFFAWAKQHERGIQYDYVSEEEYEKTKASVDRRNTEIKPLKGSMLLHAVARISDGRIIVRNTSCACNECFIDGTFQVTSCCEWTENTIVDKTCEDVKGKTIGYGTTDDITNTTDGHSDKHVQRTIENKDSQTENRDEHVTGKAKLNLASSIDRFAVAEYDGKCYLGKVCEIDNTDDTVFVKFMTSCGKYAGNYKWPTKEDALWVRQSAIVKLVKDPVPTGKTGRIYTVGDDVLELLQK